MCLKFRQKIPPYEYATCLGLQDLKHNTYLPSLFQYQRVKGTGENRLSNHVARSKQTIPVQAEETASHHEALNDNSRNYYTNRRQVKGPYSESRRRQVQLLGCPLLCESLEIVQRHKVHIVSNALNHSGKLIVVFSAQSAAPVLLIYVAFN